MTDVVVACRDFEGSLVAVVAFGSLVTGGYEMGTSDVDLLLVVADDTSDTEQCRLESAIVALETRHGLRKQRQSGRSALARALKRFADRTTDNERSFFVCTRTDLLSGNPQRIFNLPRLQSGFVDGVVVPSVLASAVTVFGEELLDEVRLHAIGRIDVVKSMFALLGQGLLAAAVYAVFPDITRYAMDALKRSVHNCHYCHDRRAASLMQEIAYFQHRYGSRPAFAALLSLRKAYRPSFRFVLQSVATIAELHCRTLIDVRFPITCTRGATTERAS